MANRTSLFTRLARWISQQAGRPTAFVLAVAVILGWVITGPVFHYSDTWQLVINTGTTIITFLMVFLIQHTQNRDSLALHLKLDELIRVKKDASNALLDLDDLTDEELEELRRRFTELAMRAKRSGARAVVKTEVTVQAETPASQVAQSAATEQRRRDEQGEQRS